MRRATRLIDRLFRAVIPYAGVLTVSTCGSTPDCEETGERRTVTMTARVTGAIALDASSDGRIATTFAPSEGGAIDLSWRCEARVGARAERRRDDTSPVVLPATTTISCAIGDGRITKRVWTFAVPLEDLRASSFAAETRPTVDVNVQDYESREASCNGALTVRVTNVIASSAGAASTPPSYVSADFTRTITTTIQVDGTTTTSTPERPCAHRLAGTLTLDVAIDASSFVESDTPTCL